MMKTLFFTFLFYTMFSVSCKKDESIKPADLGDLASAENINIFPSSHPLNRDISLDPTDANSNAILSLIGNTKGLFADFGRGLWEGAPIGIPYMVVGADEPLIPVVYNEWGNESDAGPFPIPLGAPIEGDGAGDSHVIAVDVANHMLYELYHSKASKSGWSAGSGAKYNLNVEEYRTAGWTSADAAGLPIFPCLVRFPEIQKGEIDHAIRFTLSRACIYKGYVNPARHLIDGTTNSNQLPMGGRLRLKASFDISGFSATNQIMLKALKKYGLILADAGSSMYISGAPNNGWDNDDLKNLGKVKVSDFEVVKLGTITTK